MSESVADPKQCLGGRLIEQLTLLTSHLRVTPSVSS